MGTSTPHRPFFPAAAAVCVNRFLANVNLRYMLSPVRLSSACLSVTLMHPTQAVEIFGNISTAFGTLAIR